MLSEFETNSASYELLKSPVIYASCFCTEPLKLNSEQNRHGLCPRGT